MLLCNSWFTSSVYSISTPARMSVCMHISPCSAHVWLNVSVLETKMRTTCTVFTICNKAPDTNQSHIRNTWFSCLVFAQWLAETQPQLYRQHVNQLGLHRDATTKRGGSKMAATRTGDYRSELLSLSSCRLFKRHFAPRERHYISSGGDFRWEFSKSDK